MARCAQANKKRKADALNRSIQGFLHGVVTDEHEGTAKRGVALLSELYRRAVWADARTVRIVRAVSISANALRFLRTACSTRPLSYLINQLFI